MLNRMCAAALGIDQNRDDIDAQGPAAQSPGITAETIFSQLPQLPTLGRCNIIQNVTVRGGIKKPGFHFDANQAGTVTKQQINFAELQTQIAPDQTVALLY